jgi:hypothetical protein
MPSSIIDVTTRDGSKVPAIVLPDGTIRRLDLIRPAHPNMLALPSVASQVEIIPRQEWPALIAQTMAVRSVKLRNKNQGSHGSCFPPGTYVSLVGGDHGPIELVLPGHVVRTAEGYFGRVTDVMSRQYDGPLVLIGFTDGRPPLRLTPEHPVLTWGRGYVEAAQLAPREVVATPGRPRPFQAIAGTVREHYAGPVYNLSVEGDESYVAEGVGVHNCTGHGTVSLLEFLRKLAGMADAELSPTYPYAHCNGNRDAGAQGSEVMKFVADRGTCTIDLCGEDTIFTSRIAPAADVVAPRYRFGEVLAISTFEEMATICLTRGGFCLGIEVGSQFNRLTPEGVARCARGMGNHWVMALHLAQLKDGQFGVYCQNSWGLDWGVDGRMIILEQDIFNYGDWPDATAVVSVLPDPQ